MHKNIIETVVGLIVIAVAIIFITIAYESGSLEKRVGDTYTIKAKFDRADGLKIGSDVRLGGILIGRISGMSVETSTYLAIIELAIDTKLQLPVDTQAEIVGSFLGDKYLALIPGASEEMLKPGDSIIYTQSSVNLEGLLGKFIFGTARNEQDSAANKNK